RGYGSPTTATENRYHKAVENPERRPRQSRQRGQPEELVGTVGKAQLGHFYHQNAPDGPNRKGEKQIGNGYPQIAPGNTSALGVPEFRVFWPPVIQHKGIRCGKFR